MESKGNTQNKSAGETRRLLCLNSPHSHKNGSVSSRAFVEFGVGSQNFRTELFLPGHACSLIASSASPGPLEFS